MIDEYPSGFSVPGLGHNTGQVQLLFPACGVLGALLPSGPKDLHLCSTEPDILCGFGSVPSLPSHSGHPSKAPVHGQLLCVHVARCSQDRKGTSMADEVMKSLRSHFEKLVPFKMCLNDFKCKDVSDATEDRARPSLSSRAASLRARRAPLPSAPGCTVRTCPAPDRRLRAGGPLCPRAPGTRRTAARVGRVGRTPSPGREVRHVRARPPPPSVLPGLSPVSCALGGGVHPGVGPRMETPGTCGVCLSRQSEERVATGTRVPAHCLLPARRAHSGKMA
ncbi:uncharacterized protein LOC118907941 isoform X2 [Manis pentadactyla]|nr:uncharacterized protein LOC118907941 isoform X2 [Manis pentadactyla]